MSECLFLKFCNEDSFFTGVKEICFSLLVYHLDYFSFQFTDIFSELKRRNMYELV